MSVTIKDIAKCAAVSYSTVSRALADSPGINEDTKKRIRKIARDMGYTPNALAKGLVTNSTNTLGLIVPDITNPFFPEVAQGIEECANQHGYQVFLCNTNWNIEKEKKYLMQLLGNWVNGIIISPASDDVSHIIDIEAQLPVVFAAYKPPMENSSYVVTDDYKSAFLAVEYLIKIGHRDIAFVGGQPDSSTNINRFEGYKAALGKYGIPLKENNIKHGRYKQSSGFELTLDMLVNNDIPTAIIAGDDVIALGVMQAIEEFGLNIPKDISVIGFDDIAFAALDKIQLTTVYQPKFDIGYFCVELLLDQLKNRDGASKSFRVLEPKLTIRRTTRGI